MEDPNSNQDQRRGRACAREGQGTLSESHSRRRKHDRHRRRRDVLRAQQDPSLRHMPMSPALRAISPVRSRLRGNYDKTLENPGLLKSCPTFAPSSPIFAASLQDVKSPVQQPSATSMADIRSLNNVCLENAFRSADIRLNVEATVRDHTLQTHIQWGSQLADSFNFETIVQNVRDILFLINPSENISKSDDRIRDSAISTEIYKLLPKAAYHMAATSESQLMDAFRLLKLNQYFMGEIVRRLPQLRPGRTSHTERHVRRAMDGILLEFACATFGVNKQVLLRMNETHQQEFETAMKPIYKFIADSRIIQDYVEAMGTPAALLIWPWAKAQQVTSTTLQQHDQTFISGITRFIRGVQGFRNVQGLLNHLSIWLDGWMEGVISSDLALDYLDSFVEISYNHCILSPDKTLAALLRHQRRHEADRILSRVRDTLVHEFYLGDLANPTMEMPENQFIFQVEDLGTLRPGHQLKPQALAAVLVTSDLPANVMVAPSLSYVCYENGRSPTIVETMTISPRVTVILCPVYFLHHGGKFGPDCLPPRHWVGVVVRLTRGHALRPSMTMRLIDSEWSTRGVTVYDPIILQAMIVDWLRGRLPYFDGFEMRGSIVRKEVARDSHYTESGVHTLENLLAAGRSPDSRVNLAGEWEDAQRKRYLVQILRSAAKNLKEEPGENLTEISLLEIADDLEGCDQWGLRSRRRRLGQDFYSYRS